MRRRSSQQSVIKARETIEAAVAKVLEELRPRQRKGTVISIDDTAWSCVVEIDGQESTVPIGSLVPDAPGVEVLVDGPKGDRYIVAVLGACSLRDG